MNKLLAVAGMFAAVYGVTLVIGTWPTFLIFGGAGASVVGLSLMQYDRTMRGQ